VEVKRTVIFCVNAYFDATDSGDGGHAGRFSKRWHLTQGAAFAGVYRLPLAMLPEQIQKLGNVARYTPCLVLRQYLRYAGIGVRLPSGGQQDHNKLKPEILDGLRSGAMLNPRQFFDEFVMPCVKDWVDDPLDVRKAVVTISQIDILADHVIMHQHPGFTGGQLANVRKATEQNTPIRLLVRDAHDTHKHGPLQRPTATITTGERPTLERLDGAFQPNVFRNNTFQVGMPVLEIVQDDGTRHLVENVITDALTYWEGELSSLEL
jgi:hypothetical protein